jgi:peptidylprolyl isomerase
MKFKTLIIAIGITAVALAAGCNAKSAEEVASPSPEVEVEVSVEAVVDDEVAEATEAAEATLDQEAADESLANTAEAEIPEIVLDEEAMAAFLESGLSSTASGLEYVIEKEGTGAVPEAGDIVQVHYTGKLADGTVFDSSYERDQPIVFPLGQGIVIPGWDEGISLLRVGGEAKLVIPPELAYGEAGAGGVIPPNATLYFEVELVDILPGSPDAPAEVAEEDFVTTESGLKYYDFEEGDGPTPETGQMVSVHYTGWLEDGTKFDSSLDRGSPFVFPIGMQYVIPGWDEGVSTMKVGGKRQLDIPAELAYGEEGAGEVIPPGATLIFEVELLEIGN